MSATADVSLLLVLDWDRMLEFSGSLILVDIFINCLTTKEQSY